MTIKFMGTTDDVTTCDCCGRADLKSTVAISIDEADPVFFGVVCAARALGRSAKDVRTETRRADNAKAAAEAAARKAKQDADFRLWTSYLDARSPGPRGDVFRKIEALGGYTLARAGFDALLATPGSWLSQAVAS